MTLWFMAGAILSSPGRKAHPPLPAPTLASPYAPGTAPLNALPGRLRPVTLWRLQAAGSMEPNSRSRAWLRACAASLSLKAEATASSWAKVVRGCRQAAALGNDLSFS